MNNTDKYACLIRLNIESRVTTSHGPGTESIEPASLKNLSRLEATGVCLCYQYVHNRSNWVLAYTSTAKGEEAPRFDPDDGTRAEASQGRVLRVQQAVAVVLLCLWAGLSRIRLAVSKEPSKLLCRVSSVEKPSLSVLTVLPSLNHSQTYLKCRKVGSKIQESSKVH